MFEQDWRNLLQTRISMNGYVQFETPDGEPIAINASCASFVRRFRGGNDASAVDFEKGNYVVVVGSLTEVSPVLGEG
jgi:hypothetical protein